MTTYTTEIDPTDTGLTDTDPPDADPADAGPTGSAGAAAGDPLTAAGSADDDRRSSGRAARNAQTDAFEAARLISFGLRPRLVPARDATYAELIRRYLRDPAFAELTGAIAAGLGLVILDVSERAGMVPAGAEDSAFTVRITDYARRAGGEHRAADRLLHAIAHLAIAALAFPRPADLADDSYVGRVTVEGVDAFVRQACRLLEERAAAAGSDADPPADTPSLEAAWRIYARRPSTGATRDSRRLAGSTTGIVARAMAFLVESGCLVQVGDQGGGTYRTTPRYQVQVRELAADSALEELLNLGVVTVADGSGGLRVLSSEPTLPGTDSGELSGADLTDSHRADSSGAGNRADGEGTGEAARAGADGDTHPDREQPGGEQRSHGEPNQPEPEPDPKPVGGDEPGAARPEAVRPASGNAGAERNGMDDRPGIEDPGTEPGMNGSDGSRGGRGV